MGRHSYNYGPCRFCGKDMSGAGFAVAAHNRKHVREGLVVELSKWTRAGTRVPGTSRFVMAADKLTIGVAAVHGEYPTAPVR